MVELLLCLALQLLCYGLTGEMVVRWICGFSPWKARLPEAAFLAGFPAYAVIGYAALPFARSAKSIPVAVLMVVVSLVLAMHGRPASSALGGMWSSYREWRRTRWFRAALALVILMVLLIGAARAPWQFGVESQGRVMAGTAIWDDVRTLGGPIVLAAQGYPLRSPIAVEMQWPYPAASFIYPGGMIAWMPGRALPFLVADTMLQTLFYGLAVILIAPSVTGGVGGLLLCGTALISGAFNLWHLGLKADWWWVEYFFGFHRISGQVTTVAWNPYGGLLWISNHAIGLAAILLAVKWPALLLLFALFAAGSSMDMAAMALVALGLVLTWHVWRRVVRKQPLPEWFWRALWAGVAVFAVLLWINLPTLRGEVDSPFDPAFPLNTALRFNLGLLAGGLGPYALVLFTAWRLRRVLRPAEVSLWHGASVWIVAVTVGVLFSLLFEYHAIWFWRFALASHVLFGLLCATAFRNLGDDRARRRLAQVWVLILIPGAVETGLGVMTFWKYAARRTPDQAEAMHWIARRVPMRERVAEVLDDKGVVAPSVDLLRAGNRGGASVYDRSHALTGYRDYLKKYGNLTAAIAGNDFLMVHRSSKPYWLLLQSCGAELPFQNSQAGVWRITPQCRERLAGPDVGMMVLETGRGMWNPSTPPDRLTPELLLFAVEAKPDLIQKFRQRLEKLWAAGEWERAELLAAKMVQLRGDLAEAHYSLAFTLQARGRQPDAVIHHYSEALRLGYAEFWVRYNRGNAYLGRKEYLQAFRDLSRARKLNPAHSGVPLLLQKVEQNLVPVRVRR
ncbi:MAG: tetratricopeptide repeat protein [Bryobacterales bacterium]|nr:tetratricopeptide repeat protein [Bryobacterales bacterium]